MLERFANAVVRHRILIIVLSFLLVIPAIYGIVNTKTNYDIFAYLPQNLPSVQGQNIMNDTFGYGGTGILAIKNHTDFQVQELKQRLEKIDGVEKVNWITDLADLAIPRDILPSVLTEQFYAGNSTMIQIQFQEEAASNKTHQALKEIKKMLGPNMYLAGTPSMINELRDLLEGERNIYVLAAVGFILILLGVTLPSFLLPVLLLLAIGISITYNMGLAYYITGSMSYITAGIGAALQLGVTMDFSIFLLHRYEEERKTKPNTEAMVSSIHRTALAILSSSATAVAGFLAMATMQLLLGGDIGLTMARGIILSVIMILTLLPALILVSDKWVRKLEHRAFVPRFDLLARLVTKHYKAVFVFFLLLFFPAIIGQQNVNIVYDLEQLMPKTLPSIQNLDQIKRDFKSTDSAFLVMNSHITDLGRQKIRQELSHVDGIQSVTGYDSFADSATPPDFVPPKLKDMFIKGQYSYMIIQLKYNSYDERSTRAIAEVNTLLKPYDGNVYLTGQPILQSDLTSLVKEDIKRVDLFSVIAVFLILAIAFRSLALPIFLVGGIELAIQFNQGLDFYLGRNMSFISTFAIGAIQLGSTVNYAILLVTRYREELEHHPKVEAMYRAMTKSGPAILNSALALFAATISIWMFSSINLLGDLTFMIARGTLISLFVIVFLLPAVLLSLESLTSKFTFGWPKTQRHLEERDNKAS